MASLFPFTRRANLLIGLVLLMCAAGWLAGADAAAFLTFLRRAAVPSAESPQGQAEGGGLEALRSGAIASMDDPAFSYGEGWLVSAAGADTTEPASPWEEPSGRMLFRYYGRDLALQLALGDYWGYVFVSVDGGPANRLPVLRGNLNSAGQAGGYKPLFAPEKQTAAGPAAEWLVVHRADGDGPHEATVEVWRGWGQTVLRGAAVDALAPGPLPQWPGVLMALVGGWLAVSALGTWLAGRLPSASGAGDSGGAAESRHVGPLASKFIGFRTLLGLGIGRLALSWPRALSAAVAGVAMIGAGVLSQSWAVVIAGLIALGIAALQWPVLWTGALLFGLPFYLHPLPVLPGRALNLIEIGVYGGLALCGVRFAAGLRPAGGARGQAGDRRNQFIFFVVGLALVAAVAAAQRDVAVREWRTVFLSAAMFALLLHATMRSAADNGATRAVLALAWLAGGAFVAVSGLWQYVTEQNIIQAEGVNRVRGLYGSPNNLALYLERTAAVGLGLAIFGLKRRGDGRPAGSEGGGGTSAVASTWLDSAWIARVALLLTLPQLAALLLTFSKGALFLGLPAMLIGLGAAGRRLEGGRSLRLPAWWGWGLAAVAAAMAAGLVPFLGAERFRSLLDFGPESTGGLRLNLWRSSVQMALDHPWLGVGPDNFLYSYRSGYILPAAWRDPSLNHPHNVVLDWWTRVGLPGLALAAAWLWLGIRALWRAASVDALAVGALGAVAAALGHGLIDASYALPDLMLVWVFLLHLFGPRAAKAAA